MSLLKNTTPEELKEISKKIHELSKSGKKYFLNMDTETTGLSPDYDQLTSIGCVLTDENFNEVLRFECYFNPLIGNSQLSKKYAGSEAEKITHLTESFLNGETPLEGTDLKISTPALPFSKYATILHEIFNYHDIIKVAHNKKFDMKMLEGQYKQIKQSYFTTKTQMWIDSQEIIKTHFNNNPQHKSEQEKVLEEINDKIFDFKKKITLNTLDSFDIFISRETNNEQFNRNIGGQELHGALLDTLMLSEVLKKYNIHYSNSIKDFVEEEESNPRYLATKLEQQKREAAKEPEDLIWRNTQPNTYPIIRTSASSPTNPDTEDCVISSLRVEDLSDIFKNIIKNGGNKVVISDFSMIANMINVEDEILRFNEEQQKNGEPTIEVIMGMSVFVKNEKGQKTELDIIPKSKKDFKKITKILEKIYVNDEIEPHLTMEDLQDEYLFRDLELITNGYKDSFKDFGTEKYDKNEVISFYKELKDKNPNIKMGIFETLKSINDEKIDVASEIGIDTVSTSIITYKDLEVNRIQENSSGKNGIEYHNKADYSDEETSSLENGVELDVNFNKTIDEEGESYRFIPQDPVGIPNPFEFGLQFIKDEIPLLWDRIVRFNLIDESKDLDNQDIETITKEYLRQLTLEGINKRAKDNDWTQEELEQNLEAIDKELAVIDEMGFNGFTSFVEYFTHGELRGKGRGSAAGSVVSYTVGITDINPINNGLIFERYLNLLRKGFPDIDMDFGDRNDVMERKLAPFKKLDENFYKNILTISTAGIKSSIAEICKQMTPEELFETGLMEGYTGGSLSVHISKQILGKNFDMPGTKLKDVLGNEDFVEFNEMYNSNEMIKRIVDLGGLREGVITGYGIHAAGVILKTTKENYLNNGPIVNGVPMTPIGGKIVENYVGIKMDFLGLNSLLIIESIKAEIFKKEGQKGLDKINSILENYEKEVINDPEIAKLLGEVNVGHIFQYSSELMKKIIKSFEINEQDNLLEVLSMISAIGRPGVDSDTVINNRKDPENHMELVKEYPEIAHILETTYGTIVYQEQVMKILEEIGGMNMGEAGVGQKQLEKKKQLDELKEKFLGSGNEKYQNLWQNMLDNTGYSFNKSHSISYAVTSMMMMYLKANYKKEFFIGLLNNKIDNKDYIPSIISDMKKEMNGIKLNGVDINLSGFETEEINEEVILGLGFLKGVNKKTIKKIIKDREDLGEYKDLENFLERMSKSKPITIEDYIEGLEEDLKDENEDISSYIKKIEKKIVSAQKSLDTIIEEQKTLEESGSNLSPKKLTKLNDLLEVIKGLKEELSHIKTNNISLEDIIKEFSKESNKFNTILNTLKPKTQKLGTEKLLLNIAYSGALDNLVQTSEDKLTNRMNIIKQIDTKEKENLSKTILLQKEFELTGGYLHLNHPLDNDKLKTELKESKYKQINDLGRYKKSNSEVKFYGMLSDVKRKVSGNGNDMFIGNVSDEFGEEQFILGMIDKLDEDSIKALSQHTHPVKMIGKISIDENTGDRTVFLENVEIIELDNTQTIELDNTQKSLKNEVAEIDLQINHLEETFNKKMKKITEINDLEKEINTMKKNRVELMKQTAMYTDYQAGSIGKQIDEIDRNLPSLTHTFEKENEKKPQLLEEINRLEEEINRLKNEKNKPKEKIEEKVEKKQTNNNTDNNDNNKLYSIDYDYVTQKGQERTLVVLNFDNHTDIENLQKIFLKEGGEYNGRPNISIFNGKIYLNKNGFTKKYLSIIENNINKYFNVDTENTVTTEVNNDKQKPQNRQIKNDNLRTNEETVSTETNSSYDNFINRKKYTSITVQTDISTPIWNVTEEGTLVFNNWPNSNGKYYESDVINTNDLEEIIASKEIDIKTTLRNSEELKIAFLQGSIIDTKSINQEIKLNNFLINGSNNQTFNFIYDTNEKQFICESIGGKISIDTQNLTKLLNGSTEDIKCTKTFKTKNGEPKIEEGTINVILENNSISITQLCPHYKKPENCEECNPSQNKEIYQGL